MRADFWSSRKYQRAQRIRGRPINRQGRSYDFRGQVNKRPFSFHKQNLKNQDVLPSLKPEERILNKDPHMTFILRTN